MQNRSNGENHVMSIDKKVYITRYWLSKGIITTTGILWNMDDDAVLVDLRDATGRYYDEIFRRPDWHETEKEAIAHVEKMRQRRANLLKKRLSLLQQKRLKYVKIIDVEDMYKKKPERTVK
jgi:hypothetical protein